MPMPAAARSRIAEFQHQIELLKNAAILELSERRVRLAPQELPEVACEFGRLTRNTLGPSQPGRRAPSACVVSLQELKDVLDHEPEKTFSLRGSGLEAKNVKQLAEANPSVLAIGGAGAWPAVALVT